MSLYSRGWSGAHSVLVLPADRQVNEHADLHACGWRRCLLHRLSGKQSGWGAQMPSSRRAEAEADLI